jgi:hypothetical protein
MSFVTLTQLAHRLGCHKSNALRDLRAWEKTTGRNVTESKRVAGKRFCVTSRKDADEFTAWRSKQYCSTGVSSIELNDDDRLVAAFDAIAAQFADIADMLRSRCRKQ